MSYGARKNLFLNILSLNFCNWYAYVRFFTTNFLIWWSLSMVMRSCCSTMLKVWTFFKAFMNLDFVNIFNFSSIKNCKKESFRWCELSNFQFSKTYFWDKTSNFYVSTFACHYRKKISHFASKSHSEIWKQNFFIWKFFSKQSSKVISVALNMLLTKKYLNLLFCNNSNSHVSMDGKIKANFLKWNF